jgi:hypothetical protein
MGVENRRQHFGSIRPRPVLETSNSIGSEGEVDIDGDIFHDNRLPHSVYVDSIAQQTIDSFEESGVDVMVREVPMQTTQANEPAAAPGEYGEHRTSPDIVLFDLDNAKIAGYDAKSVPAGQQGLDELREWGEDVQQINEYHGLDWRATGHDIQKRHINDDYNSPDRSPRGVYILEESFDEVRDSNALRKMFDGLYGEEADLEDAMFVSEVREEWNL